MRKSVQVDGCVRTDINYPAGFQDVITLPKTSEQFRLLYDVKGRFVLHRITPEEASYKLCRIQKLALAKKATIGSNPFHNGQAGAIPYAVTHDGRTIRFIDPTFKVNDTIKLDIATGRPVGQLKFEVRSATATARMRMERSAQCKASPQHFFSRPSFALSLVRCSSDRLVSLR